MGNSFKAAAPRKGSAGGVSLSAVAGRVTSQAVAAGRYPTDLDPALLVPRQQQQRAEEDARDTTDIDESIEENGVSQAIVVRPSSVQVGLYEIISGERRWRSATKNGLTSVPVRVVDVDDFQFEMIQWAENYNRKSIGLYRELLFIKNIIPKCKERGLELEKIRKMLGDGSKSWLSVRMAIIEGPQYILELAQSEQDIRKLYELTQLSRVDPALSEKLAGDIRSGVKISRDDISSFRKDKQNMDTDAGRKSGESVGGKVRRNSSDLKATGPSNFRDENSFGEQQGPGGTSSDETLKEAMLTSAEDGQGNSDEEQDFSGNQSVIKLHGVFEDEECQIFLPDDLCDDPSMVSIRLSSGEALVSWSDVKIISTENCL